MNNEIVNFHYHDAKSDRNAVPKLMAVKSGTKKSLKSNAKWNH
jgi:hypothetical protein